MRFPKIGMNDPDFCPKVLKFSFESSISFPLKIHGLIILKTLVIILKNVLFSKNLGTLAPSFWLDLPCRILSENKGSNCIMKGENEPCVGDREQFKVSLQE